MAEGYIDGKQVKAYRDEDQRCTMTLTHLPLFQVNSTIDNFRWAGVPFYIRILVNV